MQKPMKEMVLNKVVKIPPTPTAVSPIIDNTPQPQTVEAIQIPSTFKDPFKYKVYISGEHWRIIQIHQMMYLTPRYY